MTDSDSSTAREFLLSNRQVIDLTTQLAVGAVFVVASYRILSPFVDVIVAGGVIAIATYPLFLKTVKGLGGRRKIAATLFVLIGVGIIVVPVSLASSSLFHSAHHLSEEMQAGTLKVPPPPARVRDWPVIGTEVNGFWAQASTNLQSFVDEYRDQMKGVIGGMVHAVADAGTQAMRAIFSILIAAIFLANADACIKGLGLFSKRLFGEARGPDFNLLTAQTVRSVATGVLGVAFVQAVLAAVGMAVAGVPWVGVWSLAILLVAIVQLPPLIVLLPIALWVLGSADNPVIAWGFLIWAILVGFSDAVLKPMFLGRGVDVPMIVILIGAIGGMIASGIMGLFVGAVVLALAYRLFVEWLRTTAEDLHAPDTETAQDSP